MPNKRRFKVNYLLEINFSKSIGSRVTLILHSFNLKRAEENGGKENEREFMDFEEKSRKRTLNHCALLSFE